MYIRGGLLYLIFKRIFHFLNGMLCNERVSNLFPSNKFINKSESACFFFNMDRFESKPAPIFFILKKKLNEFKYLKYNQLNNCLTHFS